MDERVVRRVSLVGQAISDIDYAGPELGGFAAELLGVGQATIYKPGGLFVFVDVPPGQGTLRVSGPRYRTDDYPVTFPLADLTFDRPGDNDLLVLVKTRNNGNKRITFDPVTLPAPIRAGAAVLAAGGTTSLTTALDIGTFGQVSVEDVSALSPGTLARIVRGPAVRLRFDPYYTFPEEVTLVTGRVVLSGVPETSLAGAAIRLTRVNGSAVALENLAGAEVATVTLDGTRTILGVQGDIATRTNAAGDYALYFMRGGFLQNVTLEAALSGYQTQTSSQVVMPNQRNVLSFELSRA